MELPANPKNILQGVYNNRGNRVDIEEATEKPYVPWQLSDENTVLDDGYIDPNYDFGGLFE